MLPFRGPGVQAFIGPMVQPFEFAPGLKPRGDMVADLEPHRGLIISY